ncbi:MAG: DUF438 domain-containing protein [Sedimentisphaerales bacterium]|nr:DUF438 domain-containing protein [Sedimentisphaerales bacterium]
MSELINNRAKRIQALKEIIQRLHRGEDPERVRQQLTEIVKQADAGEIAAMEQEIIASGVPVEEVKSMCDLHAQVVQDILTTKPTDVAPGHPADTLKRENEAIREACRRMRDAIEAIRALPEDAEPGEPLTRWRQALNDLMDVDKHYRRKEDLFFSMLERHGISGPSKVMWAVHDEARKRLKALDEALQAPGTAAGELAVVADTIADEALTIVENMTSKEEDILLPMMLQTLTEDEWGEIWTQSPRYGWCLVEPGDEYRPPQPEHRDDTVELPTDRAVVFPTGQLDFTQLKGMFNALPVDLTFVDADDRVRFFSEGDRIFDRSKAILGRKVQHCHPPKSVHIVEQIVADFRSGRQSVAEFWIELQGKFVHIRYFAVRDEAETYLGTLEVTQDLTRLRQLQGERRLLQYDTPEEETAR